MRSCPYTTILLAVATTLPMPLHAQGADASSNVPCAAPMEWRIDEIDARFDLSADQALQAARDAASLWERAVGRDLFRFDSSGGFPIAFEFDERQASLQDRRARERALEADRASIDSGRRRLEGESRKLETLHAAYQRDLTEHDRAIKAYNRELARLGREPEAPPSVRAELERRRSELDERGAELRDRRRTLDRLSDSIRAEVERLNERVEDLRFGEASLRRDFPMVSTESGTYDETVSSRDGEVVSLDRRIRIFQVASHDDLVLVLAHELGHALGVGHAAGGGAVMSEIILPGDGALATGTVTPTDLRMLAARCPDLARPTR